MAAPMECSLGWEQALHLQRIHELRQWDTPTLRLALAWWLTTGVELCGTQDAFNAVGQLQAALRAR